MAEHRGCSGDAVLLGRGPSQPTKISEVSREPFLFFFVLSPSGSSEPKRAGSEPRNTGSRRNKWAREVKARVAVVFVFVFVVIVVVVSV